MIGRRDFFYSCPLYFFPYSRLSSVCLMVLFNSSCSHAWVFWKTLVREFPVSYSHTKWYFLISLFGAREYKHAQRTLVLASFLKWPLQTIYLKFIALRTLLWKTILIHSFSLERGGYRWFVIFTLQVHFVYLLIGFHCSFPISYKIIPYYVY